MSYCDSLCVGVGCHFIIILPKFSCARIKKNYEDSNKVVKDVRCTFSVCFHFAFFCGNSFGSCFAFRFLAKLIA